MAKSRNLFHLIKEAMTPSSLSYVDDDIQVLTDFHGEHMRCALEQS